MPSPNVIITVARKPLMGGTLAKNALKHGTGGINIDQSRISHTEDFSGIKSRAAMKLNSSGETHDPDCASVVEAQQKLQNLGRWPANLILGSTEAVEALDEQSGISVSTGGRIGNAKGAFNNLGPTGFSLDHQKGDPGFGDTGGASRFFKQVPPKQMELELRPPAY